MFTNAAKIVKIPVFRLKSLSKDAQDKAYKQWFQNRGDNLASSEELTAFQEFVDGLYESFGFILYDRHGENYYINKEFAGEDEDGRFDLLIDSIDDDDCFIGSGKITFNSIKGDSREDVARFLDNLVKNEKSLGLSNKYQIVWGDLVESNYKNKVELLNEVELGTRNHFNSAIGSMTDAFRGVLSAFQSDIEVISSKEFFEKKCGDDALFLINGDLLNVNEDCIM